MSRTPPQPPLQESPGDRIVRPAAVLFAALLATFLFAHLLLAGALFFGMKPPAMLLQAPLGEWLFGEPQPLILSLVGAGATTLLVIHGWLALRSLSDGRRHRATSLWWLQVLAGLSLFVLTVQQLHAMLLPPGPDGQIWQAGMWPIYLVLLLVVEVQCGIWLYRLIQRQPGRTRQADDEAGKQRRLRHLRHAFAAFFVALGVMTLVAGSGLARLHAAGEPPLLAVDGEKH